jgi:hypothetical protein
MKKLPENPTKVQLDQWALEWGQTLVHHYRQAGEAPGAPAFPLSEVLLVTRVGNEFYFNRAGVAWDGTSFTRTTAEPEPNETSRTWLTRGFAAKFVGHSDGMGNWIPPQGRTPGEVRRMDHYGRRKVEAKTVDDLRAAARGLESVLTDIDVRLEGEHAVIAPPYATAEWYEGTQRWTTQFNSECEPSTGALPAHPGSNQQGPVAGDYDCPAPRIKGPSRRPWCRGGA